MPYITKDRRVILKNIGDYPQSAGELNYLLTVELNEYLFAHGLSYQTINDILGALEGAKLEFYRRVAVPYEKRKIGENGDVYLEDMAPSI